MTKSQVSTKKNVSTTNSKKIYSTTHNQVEIDGISIFYREAGNPNAETILMLHGFPSSSHMYRNIIDGLSDKYHLVAPDYPGFGFSDTPSTDEFEYTFDNIAKLIEAFTKELKLDSFYLMMQDYGGPVGMRIATANPQNVKGLIIQNANIYMEGLGEWVLTIGGYAKNGQYEELAAFKDSILMSAEGIKKQYLTGAKNPSNIDPISYLTDIAFFERENVRSIQDALSNDYGNNFPKYTEWQSYLKTQQPRTLVIWGENDKFFSKPGGEAFSKDLEKVETHFFDGGHFMLEEYPEEATVLIKEFLQTN